MCVGPLAPPPKPKLAPPPSAPAPAAVLGDRETQDFVKNAAGITGTILSPNRGAASLRVDIPQIPR